MPRARSPLCIFCHRPVYDRHLAVSCDICDKWQHIKCGNTGISRAQYKKAVDEGTDLRFVCAPCESRLPQEQDVAPDDEVTQDDTSVEEAMDVELEPNGDNDEDPLNISFTVPEVEESDISAAPDIDADESIEIDAPIEYEPEIEERSFVDEPLSQSLIDEQPVTYHLLPTGSKFGNPILVATDGFSYSLLKHLKKSGGTVWRCSVRSKDCKCQAKVNGMGDNYKRNNTAHSHAADPSLLYKKELFIKVKDEACSHVYHSARHIVKTAMSDRGQRPNLPTVTNMQRNANRQRQKLRPPNPTDLDFEVNHDYLCDDDFIVGDLRVDNQRHIMFSTEKQLDFLRQSKRWFMDGTFKVVDRPFRGGQLMSIHGFVKSDEAIKQVPLLFVLMSSRRKGDYVAVLRKTKELLGEPCVEGFVGDFEAAAWSAIRDVFPDVQIKGCVFHWSQSVFRHVKSLGLGPAYMERGSIWNYIRQLLVLPFLPANHIQPVFDQLAARANTNTLSQLVEYIRTTWIESTLFAVETWSIYMHRVRTNNDVEGWHNRLNGDCGQRALSFYKLVPALRKQTKSVEIDIQELVEHGVGRLQRAETRRSDAKIFKYWNEYNEKRLSATSLLKKISRVYGPAEYIV